MVHRGIAVLALACGLAWSTGCFQSETLLKVRADGSGTIEQRHLMNAQMVGMAAAMAGAAAKEAGGNVPEIPTDLEALLSEEQLRKQAAAWGSQVRFVSRTPIEQGALKGVNAIFAFDDVRTLALGHETREPGSTPMPAGPPMRFNLTTVGERSVLSITFPEGTGTPSAAAASGTPAAPAAPPPIPPEALAMVKSMFEGARLAVAVEVDGRVTATNAPASSGSRATLVEIDFAELLSDPAQLGALQSLKPGVDFPTVRRTLDGVKGVVFPIHQVVSVEFSK